MTQIVIKPGDDIRWAGQITQEGVSDWSGYTLTSQIRSRSEVDGSMVQLQATATIVWIDTAQGLFTYSVDRAVTALWPKGVTLYLDISVLAPGDTRVRTVTQSFKTDHGVTV